MSTIMLDTTTLEILPDESPENPRDWDHLGTMACWHRRYALGDKHEYRDPQAFSRDINAGNAVILPLYLFDHSALTLSTDCESFRGIDLQGWDWGQVGYVYVTLEDVRRKYGVRRVTRQVRECVLAHLRSEVAVYNQYLQGDVYGFVLKDRTTGEVFDSCWGFYGENPWQNGMAECLPADIREQVLSYFHRDAA